MNCILESGKLYFNIAHVHKLLLRTKVTSVANLRILIIKKISSFLYKHEFFRYLQYFLKKYIRGIFQ